MMISYLNPRGQMYNFTSWELYLREKLHTLPPESSPFPVPMLAHYASLLRSLFVYNMTSIYGHQNRHEIVDTVPPLHTHPTHILYTFGSYIRDVALHYMRVRPTCSNGVGVFWILLFSKNILMNLSLGTCARGQGWKTITNINRADRVITVACMCSGICGIIMAVVYDAYRDSVLTEYEYKLSRDE